MATIFEALRTQIGTLTAVTSLVGNRIRPLRFPTKDDIRAGGGILIDPLKETDQVDIDAGDGAEFLELRFRCVASSHLAAYAIAQALRSNGQSPHAGLQGFAGTVGGVVIEAIALRYKEFSFEWFEDGSDEGYYVVDWHGDVSYSEAP